MGIIIKFPIDDFNETNKENNNLNNKNPNKEEITNEIKLLLKIEKEDINKKIYFLDNT